MRILHTVEFYEPSKGGSEEVVRQISQALARRGHEVTVATSFDKRRTTDMLNGVHIRQFKIRGNAVKGISGDVRAYHAFVRDSGFDTILNYGAQTWCTDACFPLLPEIKARKFIVPLGYSKLGQPRYASYYEKLPQYLRHYDQIVYTSEGYQDKKFGDQHGLGDRAVVIPNGANVKEFGAPGLGFRNRYGIGTKYMFLTVANHYFAKGHSFVLKAVSQLKRKDCSIIIIGDLPRAHAWYSCFPSCSWVGLTDRKVKILRNVPREWVVSAFQEADLFLFGSKVECSPLVMYESFAAHLPFVTTNVGNVVDHKKFLWIAKDPSAMTQIIRDYLENPAAFKQVADRAYHEIALERTWESISQKYQTLYESDRK